MKKFIIATCEEWETKVAILENSEVAELFVERENDENILGNIYYAKIENILPNLEAMFLNAGISKSAYLPFDEIVGKKPEDLKKDDKILIQITKGPISTKGARCTTNISLPGKYLVFQPLDKGIGISKNIASQDERDRLKKIFEKLTKKIPGGFIIRSKAENIDEEIFKTEIRNLKNIWKKILENFEKASNPKLLHQDYNILFKMVREKLNDEMEFFAIDSLEDYKKTLTFAKLIAPEFAEKIIFHNDGKTLFEEYDIDSICEKMMKQKIYLKSGGYLIIQEAESLCAIDVNSGSTKGENFEQVVLKTNLEAVKEIALQLRLRNIGGIIVIDFIDMEKEEHRKNVYNTLKEAVKLDKAKIKIWPITDVGLIEMTRQRKSESILSFLSDKCPYCRGTGRIYSKDSILSKIKLELKKIEQNPGMAPKKVLLHLNPDFEGFMKNKKKFLRKNITFDVEFIYDHKTPINQYEIVITDEK